MCRKCQENCSDCQKLLKKYVPEAIDECENCGHLFKINELTNGLCERCKKAEKEERGYII